MKQITDLLDVQVSMDAEDRELMRMFPRSRQTVLNDMLFVQDKSGAFCVKNSTVDQSHVQDSNSVKQTMEKRTGF